MAPAGTVNGEPAFIVTDSRLSKCEMENYNIGKTKGLITGIVLTAAIGLCIRLAQRKEKKEKKEEK